MRKILPVEKIPELLWCNGVLRLPQLLEDYYVEDLERKNLTERAKNRQGGAIGGAKPSDTCTHYAEQFVNSAGRVAYATLGPCGAFLETSEFLLTTLSDGHIAILDIPSGTGAASAALVGILIELRSQAILPKLPLTVSITAGDFEAEALSIYAEIMDHLSPLAEEQGICVNVQCCLWNAFRTDRTAELIDSWLEHAENHSEYIIIISNFSGELRRDNNFEKFSYSLSYISTKLHTRTGTLAWFEPASNVVKNTLIGQVTSFFSQFVPWLNHKEENGLTFLQASYKMHDPLKKGVFPTGVILKQLERK